MRVRVRVRVRLSGSTRSAQTVEVADLLRG